MRTKKDWSGLPPKVVWGFNHSPTEPLYRSAPAGVAENEELQFQLMKDNSEKFTQDEEKV